jgi:hypothetical protein
MANTGKADCFSVPHCKTMRDIMEQTAAGTKDAVRHMLSLGIIRFDADLAADAYAYHWTNFGKAVLSKLGIR